MKFLCGCSMPSLESLQGDRELKTLDTVAYDDEGFLICVVHRQRRYGWRSSMHGARLFPGLSDYEVEQVEIFGAELIGASYPLLAPTVVDRRDNRDPETFEIQPVGVRHAFDAVKPVFPKTPSEEWREFMERQRQAATA